MGEDAKTRRREDEDANEDANEEVGKTEDAKKQYCKTGRGAAGKGQRGTLIDLHIASVLDFAAPDVDREAEADEQPEDIAGTFSPASA